MAGPRSAVHRWLDEPMTAVAARARIIRPWRVRRFAEFGKGSILHKPLWVYGPQKITVGDGAIMLHGLWLAAERSGWPRPGPTLTIGSRVGIRPWCSISASESIEIEDDVVIAAYTTVVDSDHTWSAGIPNIVWNPTETSPIRIGRGTWIAERCAILRGSDIGRFCIIGANSVVRGTIPDYSIAVGSPARVVGATVAPGGPGGPPLVEP